MNETGSVKFKCDLVEATLPRFSGFDELNACRRKLLDLGMVGVDANGVVPDSGAAPASESV